MEAKERHEPFEERHFTVPELAEMWNLSREFVRQVVQGEPGVTEWVRQQPGRRRYRGRFNTEAAAPETRRRHDCAE